MAIEYTNIENILSFYEKNIDSNYTIYRGIKCIHVADIYRGSNKDQGYNQLEEYLKTINNGNEYVLQIVSGKVTKELAPSCIFKLEKKEERQQVGAYYNNNSEVLSRLQSIEANLANISAESEEQDYVEDQPKNFIGKILEQPGFQEMIISGIGSLIANFMQPKIEAATMPTVLAGINETDQTAEESLKILYSKGLTTHDLFILSKKTKVELNYLLKMLRS